jgi:LssY C-terminus
MASADHIASDRGTVARAAFALSLLLLATACASSTFERPAPFDDAPLRARAVTKTDADIRASAAIPSVDESRSIFGIDLAQQGVEPLWLEIENSTDRPLVFLPTGLDPEYFAPLEVAFSYKDSFNDQGNAALGEHLKALSFDSHSPIVPGETVSGFVYANQVDPAMMVDVDLVGRAWSRRIALLVPMPGTEAAQERVARLRGLYADADVVEIDDEAALRTALEEMPCCMTDVTGTRQGPPLNVVMIGDLEEFGPPFARRRYRYNPAEPWYVFGREQDVSAHKISRWVAPQPHTLRFWLAPLRYQGKPIWIGQVSTSLGGRFAAPGEEPRRIDPDVDEARNDVVQDLLYSQALARVGFVKGAGSVSAAEPRQTPDGSSYHTDGLRAVLMFGGEAVSLAEVDFFDWERLVDHYRQVDTSETR